MGFPEVLLFLVQKAGIERVACGQRRSASSGRLLLTAAGLFLELNGYALTASNEEVLKFTQRAAVSEVNLESMAVWLEAHSQAIDRFQKLLRSNVN